jgi:glycosyltransferase involved in cell wall biosynthesis
MRLLYLSADPGVPVLGHKGASVHVREMVSAFCGCGASVLVCSPRVAPEGDVLDAPAKITEIPPVLPHAHATAESAVEAMAVQADQVTRIARRWRAEAIYERYSLFSHAGVRAARTLGIAHVLEVNAPLREEARRFRDLPHPELAADVEAEVYAATECVFAVSTELAALLSADGASACNVEVMPNAVAADRFGRPRDRPAGTLTVGFAGSLKPWHGIDVLVSAFNLALASAPDLRLEVIGTGPQEQTLLDSALPAGALTHHGALPHRTTLALMSRWDVGVAPYVAVPDFYFSPLKVREYMAGAVCPVVSDVGELGALLGRGQHGVTVPAGDPAALADVLVTLALDPREAAALGRSARQHVRALSGWDANARRALEVLSGRGW